MEELKTYVGCKMIKAKSMTRWQFIDHKGGVFEPGDKKIAGYLVQYPDGYESWSPKESFEGAYRLITPSEKELIE